MHGTIRCLGATHTISMYPKLCLCSCACFAVWCVIRGGYLPSLQHQQGGHRHTSAHDRPTNGPSTSASACGRDEAASTLRVAGERWRWDWEDFPSSSCGGQPGARRYGETRSATACVRACVYPEFDGWKFPPYRPCFTLWYLFGCHHSYHGSQSECLLCVISLC